MMQLEGGDGDGGVWAGDGAFGVCLKRRAGRQGVVLFDLTGTENGGSYFILAIMLLVSGSLVRTFPTLRKYHEVVPAFLINMCDLHVKDNPILRQANTSCLTFRVT